jgi:hypothetical protein
MLAGGHRGIGANERRSLSLVRNGFNKTEEPTIQVHDPSTTAHTLNSKHRSLIMTPPAKGKKIKFETFGSTENNNTAEKLYKNLRINLRSERVNRSP